MKLLATVMDNKQQQQHRKQQRIPMLNEKFETKIPHIGEILEKS